MTEIESPRTAGPPGEAPTTGGGVQQVTLITLTAMVVGSMVG